MKKILFVLLLAAMMVPTMAQEKAAYVYRFGNTYMQDGIRMNEREYAGFIKNNSPEAFKMYQNGRRLAVAGWCMLAGGIALDVMGTSMMVSRFLKISDDEYKKQRIDMADIAPDIYEKGEQYVYDPKSVMTETKNRAQKDGTFVAGEIIESIGATATITSIPLLVVGYLRIHRSADVYNQNVGATPYVTLNAVPRGLGLAVNF